MNKLNFHIDMLSPANPFVSDTMQGGKKIAITFPAGKISPVFIQQSVDGETWTPCHSVSPTPSAVVNVSVDNNTQLRVRVSVRPVEALYEDYNIGTGSGSGGGGGTTSNNYNDLFNKPKINGKTLSGNVTIGAAEVGALPTDTKIPSKISDLEDDDGSAFHEFLKYSKIENDIEEVLKIEEHEKLIFENEQGRIVKISVLNFLESLMRRDRYYYYSSSEEYGDFNINSGVLVKYNGQGGDVVIPDYVNIIGPNAFDGCTSLSSVIIPDSVYIIGSYAFYGCTSLKSISIPGSVRYIEHYAFGACASLSPVTIPESVVYIGYNAFIGVKEILNLSSGVTGKPWGALNYKGR